MVKFLDFERPVAELSEKIEELRHISDGDHVNLAEEINRLQTKSEKLLRQMYSKLTPAQRLKVSRHEDRPHGEFYIHALFDDFVPLAGDRLYAEDRALITGIGRFRGISCLVIAHEKGDDMKKRLEHNFAMARPEGYRKVIRLMKMAERLGLPVIAFVDTAGAYPGVGAEERGQSEAIAKSIQTCFEVKTPFLSVIIGEGGSGGAIAIAGADYVAMLEHAVYSVISPEGCASILWRGGEYAEQAAEALKITAPDLHALGVIDAVIPEPIGGAHRDRDQMVYTLANALEARLKELMAEDKDKLLRQRRDKFLQMTKSVSSL